MLSRGAFVHDFYLLVVKAEYTRAMRYWRRSAQTSQRSDLSGVAAEGEIFTDD